VDVGAIPSTPVTEIAKAFSNYVPGREPQHAPMHALDKAYAKLRETVPAVENTLHPQLQAGLKVFLHAARQVRPRAGSEKRARDGSVGSTETAPKKGKTGQVSQSSSAQPTSQSGKATSQSKSQQKRARSSSKGRSGTQKGKTDSKGGSQGEKSKKDNKKDPPSKGGGGGRRPPRSGVGQSRYFKW